MTDLIANMCGSGMTEDEAMTGPMGANLSNDFAYPAWFAERSGHCHHREDTSFPAV